MANCPTCGVNTILQSDPKTCTNCGTALPIRTLRNTVEFDIEYHEPTPEEQREQLTATLQRMKQFHREQGDTFTWEFTERGATCYVNGHPDGEIRLEKTPEDKRPATKKVHFTSDLRCPGCKAPIHAMSDPADTDIGPPTPGDHLVCTACTTLLIITEPGGLRLATKAEIDGLEEDQQIQLGELLRNLRVSKAAGVPTRVEQG